ncbi:MAG: hypothetical protein GY705_30035 [Bacteroidetes bacterium]|nr:hypothetical protein [Bacteroidota bacterium]
MSLQEEEIWLINFMLPEVESWSFVKNGSIEKKRSGILVPASERHFKKRYGHLPLLPITLPEAGYRNYYWRISTNQVNPDTDFSIEVNWSLLAPSFVSHYRSVEGFILALHLGLFLAVGIYHLVIFFYSRELGYLWFALFCFASFMTSMTMSEYSLQFLWPELPVLHYVFFRGLTLFSMYLFLIVFTMSYLQTSRLTPVWHKILLALLGLLVLGFGYKLLNKFNPQINLMLLSHLGTILQILLILAIFSTAIQCLRKGYRPAKLYLLASVSALSGMILNILNVKELLPWTAHLSWVQLGRAIQLILFSFELAQSFKSLLDEKTEAQRLKELDAVKTKLYTNITHEFRTPLTIILGMAKQVRDNPKDWFREGLKMIIRNGQNLLQLVNQMLDLSKLESGSMPLNLIQGDIIAYIKYVFESFHSLAKSKNIHLHFKTDLEELVMDYDPKKI